MTASLQSSSTVESLTTTGTVSWNHTGGVTGSGYLMMAFVGTIDTPSGAQMKALSATFSGSTYSPETMTLAQEVIGDGRAFPSVHVFTLTEPTFTGIAPDASGDPDKQPNRIRVTMSEPATNNTALSMLMEGINTTATGYIPGSFSTQSENYLTSTGALSGIVSSTIGDLLIDCVVANAGIPDDHILGPDQILDARVPLNSAGSAKISVSHTLATPGEHGKSMSRSSVTKLDSVNGIKFAVAVH